MSAIQWHPAWLMSKSSGPMGGLFTVFISKNLGAPSKTGHGRYAWSSSGIWRVWVSAGFFYACSKCRHDDFNRVTVLFKSNLCVKLGRVTRRVQIPASGFHDDVIKWKHFPRYPPFVRGIHRSRWIPRTKASDAELWCFLWSALE